MNVSLVGSHPLLVVPVSGQPRGAAVLSYPISVPIPSTHRMHDPGSIVPHIRSEVFTDHQMSQIKYNYI
jgi:hypothetical protein